MIMLLRLPDKSDLNNEKEPALSLSQLQLLLFSFGPTVYKNRNVSAANNKVLLYR